MAAMVNPIIGSAPGDTDRYVLPDWNSDAYFTRLQEVVSAIGAHYHDDPTLLFPDRDCHPLRVVSIERDGVVMQNYRLSACLSRE